MRYVLSKTIIVSAHASRVSAIYRIGASVVVPVHPVAVANRIGLEETAERGRVHSCFVVVNAELGYPFLAGVLEPQTRHVTRARDPVFVVAVPITVAESLVTATIEPRSSACR